ncbi:hypothetical protein ACFC0M_05930 [Streptomyces sp. NPDC056149]|uniref:hypothetical protein n=1 Tax=Streptomyces sp. NPDC056149 TaxID=3345728 RepID=UPI0035E0EDD5
MAQLPMTELAWEDVGVRRLMAVVLTALGTERLDTGHLVWHLAQGPEHLRQVASRLVGDELAEATDIDPDSVDRGEPGLAAWVWLTRTWPADGPWDGMPRGVAPGLTFPAVEVLSVHAVHVALAAHTREQGGHGRGELVVALEGPYSGRVATVQTPSWQVDDEHQTVIGPPVYEVLVRNPDASQGRERQVLGAEQLRTATREEQALERAHAMGIETTFDSTWQACERWAIAMVWWHRQERPERWLVDPDPDGRGVVVTGLVAAALYDTVREHGLHAPADGSRVVMAPLAPVANTFSSGWPSVLEVLERLPAEEGDTPTLETLRAIRRAGGAAGSEQQAVLDLALDVAWTHAGAAKVPSETTIGDLAGDTMTPRLADQLDAFARAVHRERDRELGWPEDL